MQVADGDVFAGDAPMRARGAGDDIAEGLNDIHVAVHEDLEVFPPDVDVSSLVRFIADDSVSPR